MGARATNRAARGPLLCSCPHPLPGAQVLMDTWGHAALQREGISADTLHMQCRLLKGHARRMAPVASGPHRQQQWHELPAAAAPAPD
jgi:hypothetical protein